MQKRPSHAPMAPKQQARDFIEQLPDEVSWQELAYRLGVRADIESALEDVEAGRTTDNEQVRSAWSLVE